MCFCVCVLDMCVLCVCVSCVLVQACKASAGMCRSNGNLSCLSSLCTLRYDVLFCHCMYAIAFSYLDLQPQVEVLGSEVLATTTGFFDMVSGDANSGPHAYAADPLLTRPFPKSVCSSSVFLLFPNSPAVCQLPHF